MALLKLKIRPDSQGYAFNDSAEVRHQPLEGGPGRYRRVMLGASAFLDLGWTTTANGYAYLKSFHQLTGEVGAAFLLDLILDAPGFMECTAYFVPGTFGLASQSGRTYRVKARIEVQSGQVAPPTDDDGELYFELESELK